MKKTVALLMPVLNEEHSAKTTLDSIFSSTRLPDEIIIADGGSTDKTLEIVEQFNNKGTKLIIVKNPEIFAGAGRNAAFRVSSSDIIMLVDFGNTVHKDWIEKMAAPFENQDKIDFVSGAFIPYAETDFEHLISTIIYHDNKLLEEKSFNELVDKIPKSHAPGALSLAISRSMWLKTGGMPSWLRTAEDKLFGRKMMALKPKYQLLPDARISHHMRSNSWQLFKQMYTYSRGNGRTRSFQVYVAKLFILYLLLLSSLIFIPFNVISCLLYLSIIGFYTWFSGIKKVILIDNKLKKFRYIPLTALIVFTRDIGTFSGYALGVLEWFFKPNFRHRFMAYISGTSIKDYPIIIR